MHFFLAISYMCLFVFQRPLQFKQKQEHCHVAVTCVCVTCSWDERTDIINFLVCLDKHGVVDNSSGPVQRAADQWGSPENMPIKVLPLIFLIFKKGVALYFFQISKGASLHD